MTYNPEKHKRTSIRLKGYDYSQPGYYFITICTKNRECIFGIIEYNKVLLNNIGEMVRRWWLELRIKYENIHLDGFVVMPNHIHGILIVSDNEIGVGANLRVRPNKINDNLEKGQTRRSAPTLGDVIRWFKTMTTNEYIKYVKQNGWKPIEGKLWQRNYYDHIIRKKEDLNKIRQYIKYNPANWELDKNNPININVVKDW
jgi:REP element-mobilizing transposase RayT